MALGRRLTVKNLIVIILAIIGLVWLLYALWRNLKIDRITGWPKANATIVNTAIETGSGNKTITTYMDPRYIATIGGHDAKFNPKVLYRYTVGNREYQSTNLIYGENSSYSALDIQTIMGNLQPGSVVPVYYNPNNWSEAYIYNGNKSYLGIIAGILLLIAAGLIGYHHNVSGDRKNVGYTNIRETTPDFSTEYNQPSVVYKTNNNSNGYSNNPAVKNIYIAKPNRYSSNLQQTFDNLKNYLYSGR